MFNKKELKEIESNKAEIEGLIVLIKGLENSKRDGFKDLVDKISNSVQPTYTRIELLQIINNI